MKTSSRLLEDVFHLRLQDVLIKTNIFTLVIRLLDVFKTSWSRPIYSPWLYVFKTSSRRFQDVFKISSRRFQNVLQKRLQDVLQKRFQDVFKTPSRPLAKIFSRCFQDVLLIKLFLLTSLREVLERRLSTGGFAYVTLLRHLWSEYKICKGDKNFSSFSLLLH